MGKKYDLANFLPKRRKEVEKTFLVVFLREKNREKKREKMRKKRERTEKNGGSGGGDGWHESRGQFCFEPKIVKIFLEKQQFFLKKKAQNVEKKSNVFNFRQEKRSKRRSTFLILATFIFKKSGFFFRLLFDVLGFFFQK